MGIIYHATLRTNRMQEVLDFAGAARLEIQDASDVVLSTIPLANPFGTLSGDVITFTVPQSDTSADATGTATKARIVRISDSAIVASGLTVGTSGTNIIVGNTSFVSGDPINLTAGTITHNTAG